MSGLFRQSDMFCGCCEESNCYKNHDVFLLNVYICAKKQNRYFSFRFCICDIALYPFHFCFLQFIPADFTHPLFDGIVTDIHIHVSTLHGIGFFDDASTFPNQIAGEVMNFHTVFPVL